ncbi:MAG: hypothetical protein FJ087_23310, partial [Deltaproteobacteria bacterium]|nr:hypothetical protein [Deltaproteobacteria bacterium]
MTLHLVDGSGYIHRAFHAIRGLRTSRGLATNAVYGFATMLRKFARESRPELCAVVFDAGRETFRSQMYADYKMNRPAPAEDLAVQFPYARRIAAALGFPIVEAPGFEADDVIATLATRACAAGWRVVIDSADKDLFQLVNDCVTVWDPMRERTYDEAGVREKLGVAPSQVRDWLALVGDSSDNIPGVTGIGEKGATELIAAGGSLEGVYERLDTLAPRRREALVTNRECAFLSRDLATLRHDVPVDLELESLRPAVPDRRTLTDLLTELEFRSLLAEVVEEERRERASGPGGAAPVAGEPAAVAVAVGRDVSWEAALAEVAAAESPAVAAVFGTRDPSCPDCLAIGVATTPERALVFPPSGAADGFLGDLAAALARTSWRAANFKELFQVFAARGVELALPGLDPVIGNYVLHPERESQSLDSLALEALQLSLPPAKDAAPGAVAARACAVARVSAEVASGLEEAGLSAVVRDVEVPLARVLAEMEATGIAVDRGALSAMSVSLAGDLQAAEKRILEAAGTVFNPNSTKQLAEVLFGKLHLPVVRKTKTGPSTDVSVG